MTNFPSSIDDDITLPSAQDNIIEIGAEAIQAIREAVLSIEENIGIKAHGSMASIAARLAVSINENGTMKESAILGLGAGLINNAHISSVAAIAESKLALAYTTSFLFDKFTNLTSTLDARMDVVEAFVNGPGSQISSHIAGTNYKHKFSHFDVDSGALNRVNINTGVTVACNVSNGYNFVAEISNDLLAHTRADGAFNTTTPSINKAHNASGIHINTSNFASVPQTTSDLQKFAEFVDSSSLILLGSRTQNLFSGGLPKATRNTSLVNDKAAEAIVDPTLATTYLLFGGAANPVDNIDNGDDVILLSPSSAVLANNTFDAQFSQVRSGDYITVNYGNGTSPVVFVVDSAKKFLNGTTRVYSVRINGKNLFSSTTATVRIDRPFYHESKFNGLALAVAHNNFAELPSLIMSNPSGAAAIGNNFDPDQLDQNHYNLYLQLFPSGNPAQKSLNLPAIDVTGNSGTKPGSYTLQSIIENINNKFRDPGFNGRFIAFPYQGNLGIALADRYNNASFSIISGAVDGYGAYTSSSNSSFNSNVVDNFNLIDPLGLGIPGANVASPPFAVSYSTAATALQSPTLIFAPLKKNFYYIDGVERDSFALEVLTSKDGYGDGYWAGTLTSKQVLANRVETTYTVNLNLCTSGLKKGKTLVVQPAVGFTSTSYSNVDYGRFTISNVVFNDCAGSNPTTTITVYDAVHATGVSPFTTSLNIPVHLYFSPDSVSFNTEHISDPQVNISFKRFFEIYVDTNGKTHSHERARFNTTGSNITVDSANNFVLNSSLELANFNIVDVSSKLRGFSFGQYRKINLVINSFNETTGVIDGYLCKFTAPSTYTNLGPLSSGKKGENIRFYDDTTIDYVDINIELDASLTTFTNKNIDIQLFPTLQLNEEKLLVGTCQLRDSTKKISNLIDRRQFGNVSERHLSTSAINFITAPQRLLDENGIIRGFDLVSSTTLTNNNKITLRGGTALIDGKIVTINDSDLYIPIVQEALSPLFSTTLNTVKWYLCANSKGEYEFVASTDYTSDLDTTYGSLDHNRIFYAKNPAQPSVAAYPVRATYLQNLLLENKDLVPLYIISATVASVVNVWKVSSATVSDIRRYTEKGHRGLTNTFVLGKKGTFRSLASVKSIINELTNNKSYRTNKQNIFGKTVYVRDNFDVSSFDFDFAVKTTFVGDNAKFTVSTVATTLTKNVEFKDLAVDVSIATGFNIAGSDIIFNNCEISYTYDATSDGSFTATQLSNPTKACILSSSTSTARKNIKITNCKFSSNVSNRFAFVSLLLTGEDHYYENIVIDNNYIEGTVAATDDKRAAFIIACTSAATPSTQLGPRLVNCFITKNVCNKNQLILISGETNGSSKIANMPVPVNVHIEKNVCGAICYLVRQDRSLNVVNSTSINDKDNMLIISGNSCRYIYCGTNKGFINVIGSSNRVINDIIASANVYSSSVIIEKNTCSWIQVGVKNPTSYAFETPLLEVSGNKINAYLSTYLNDYHSVISPTNVGLIIDEVAGT